MRRYSLPALLLVCALIPALTMSAQDKAAAQKGAAKGELKKPAPKPVILVNGEAIMDVEVSSMLRQQLGGRQAPPNVLPRLRQQVIDLLVNARLIEQHMKKEKIEADAKEVKKALDDINKRITAAGLKLDDVLKNQGLTRASLESRIKGQIAFNSFADKQITDDKQKSFFEKNKADFDGSEVRASHLLIKLDPGADEKAKAAAKTKIDAIRKEIVGGLKFADAAKKYSEGPSGPSGGDLGFFPRRNRMVEPFAAAAFAMKKGEVSQPVTTRFGLHLIAVTDVKPGTRKLKDVAEQVKGKLKNDLWVDTVKELRKTAKIEPAQKAGAASKKDAPKKEAAKK